eukprot:CAMPEP_0203850666 /NCGR_PEP_ID=MMETSP0359-20131031/6897_1 /ASSEMBLY_ACC=CAM_ASM_000338 /TAXON_ID=268821 /ORGANISM="Scrippsiella Hangoei, Strain SHTV-5" /LENGTH=1478 /DNA_ID=CAMNT_0050766577 /DNA_START=169 /DNA_END=4601 /DNA_ORIENTATION=-
MAPKSAIVLAVPGGQLGDEPLDDSASIGDLVLPQTTVVAAPRPLPNIKRTPAPPLDESVHSSHVHGAPAGVWTLNRHPAPFVTTSTVVRSQRGVLPGVAPDTSPPAVPELSLALMLCDDWEQLSAGEQLATPSDSGARAVAGQMMQHVLCSDCADLTPNLGLGPFEVADAAAPFFLLPHESSLSGIDQEPETLVFTWGDNSLGQCLIGAVAQQVQGPSHVPLDCRCVSLCCSSDRSILVTKRGTLWGGGLNAGRTLSEAAGDGSLDGPTLLDVPELVNVGLTAVAAGREHVLAVTEHGTLLAWAASTDEGEAGVDSDFAKAGPVWPKAPLLPLQGLNVPRRVATVACGDAHSMVLTACGQIYSFGSNTCGQLGIGANVQQASTPVVVGSRARGLPMRSVAAGAKHSLALTLSGALLVWGSNEDGCLGLGAMSSSKAACFLPALAPGLPGPGRYIAAGGCHSAVIVQGGRLLLAGSNSCGQLGHPRCDKLCSFDFDGVLNEGELCARSASLGHEHSLVLTYDGKLFAFGRNREGQCGVANPPPQDASTSCVEVPSQVSLPSPLGSDRSPIVWAVAAGRHHNLVLCSPAPDADERLVGSDVGNVAKRPFSSTGQRMKPPLQTRRSTFPSLDLRDVPVGAPGPLDARIAALTGTGVAASSKAANFPATNLPSQAKGVRTMKETALFKQVVQPGAAPCLFMALSLPRLTSLLEGATSVSHDEHVQALCVALVRPSVLNASFCYPGLRKARLDAAGLCRTLAMLCARDVTAGPRLLDAAAEGLALLADGPVEDLVQPDQLRALAIYMCIPARRPATIALPPLPPGGGGARQPRSILAGIAHLVMRMPAVGRIALRDLLADDCGDARVLGDFIVPHIRHLADDAIRNTGQQPWLAGALWEVVNQLQLQRPLWEAVLLLQIVASASERAAFLLRPSDVAASATSMPPLTVQNGAPEATLHTPAEKDEEQDAELVLTPSASGLGDSVSSRSSMLVRTSCMVGLLDAAAFQLTSLAEGYIPPEVEFWLFQEHAQFCQISPTEVVNEPWWSDVASMLPRRFCSFMAHANLVPVAFKQRVLQVENVLRQRLSQEQVLWPQAEALLAGGRVDPAAFYFMLRVNRQDLLRETLAQMYSASPVDLRRPLRVEFIGEEAVDEGGVMREFFRVLSRELFSPEAGLFFEAEGSRRLWFNPTLAPGRQLEDYWMVGVIIALAVYNNHPGLDVRLPSVLFKKLKGEPVTQDDLMQLFPVQTGSLQALLAWAPSQPADTEADAEVADAEFEATFCLSFCFSPPSPASRVGVGAGSATRPEEQPLCQGGAERPVLYRDRACFVALAQHFLMHSSVQAQFESFARGFRHVCNSPLFDVLRAEELEAIVAGQIDLDFTHLRQGAQYEGYASSEPYIDTFWQVLEAFDKPRRRRFLAFCTGSDVAPTQGLQDLRLLVQRHGEEPTNRLPVAHTCFNLLLLPRYSSPDKLRTRLIMAIEWTEG